MTTRAVLQHWVRHRRPVDLLWLLDEPLIPWATYTGVTLVPLAFLTCLGYCVCWASAWPRAHDDTVARVPAGGKFPTLAMGRKPCGFCGAKLPPPGLALVAFSEEALARDAQCKIRLRRVVLPRAVVVRTDATDDNGTVVTAPSAGDCLLLCAVAAHAAIAFYAEGVHVHISAGCDEETGEACYGDVELLASAAEPCHLLTYAERADGAQMLLLSCHQPSRVRIHSRTRVSVSVYTATAGGRVCSAHPIPAEHTYRAPVPGPATPVKNEMRAIELLTHSGGLPPPTQGAVRVAALHNVTTQFINALQPRSTPDGHVFFDYEGRACVHRISKAGFLYVCYEVLVARVHPLGQLSALVAPRSFEIRGQLAAYGGGWFGASTTELGEEAPRGFAWPQLFAASMRMPASPALRASFAPPDTPGYRVCHVL